MPNQRTETLVNTTAADHQSHPAIAMLPDGGWIVVWISTNQGGDAGGGIWFQRYNAAGQAVSADGTVVGAAETHVNTVTAGNQFYPRIAVLSDGKFAIVWDGYDGQDGSGEGVFAQLFAADGTPLGAEVLVNATTNGRQAEPLVTALPDGGYVISWGSNDGPGDASGYRVYAQRFDGNGNFVAWSGAANGNVQAQTLINTSTSGDQGWNSQVVLADGKLLMLYGSRHLTNTTDVFGKVFNADGTVATDEFSISQYRPSEQLWPSATVLADGRVVVVWGSNGQDGDSYGVYARFLSPAGVPVGDEFRVNTTTGGNQSYANGHEGAQIEALGDGGFIVAWHGPDFSASGIYYQRFDAEGDKVGGEVLANTGIYGGEQFIPRVVATEGGFQLVWHSDNGDGSGYSIYQKSYDLEDAIVRLGGEDRVNTATGFNQRLPQVVSDDDGSYVVVWMSQSTYNTGDGSGWGLIGQRFNADGTKAGGEFSVITSTAGDQPYDYAFQVTKLNDGRFVVVWGDYNRVGDGDYVSIGQVFNADGTKSGTEFRLNDTTSGEQLYPAIASLADGGFVAVYRGYYMNGGSSYDVFFQRFDAAGAKVGAETRVSVADAVNTSDGSEHQGRVLGLADGGWIVMFADSGNDGSGEGLYARRYDASGALVGGTSADGTASAGSWRVNLQTVHDQYMKYQGMAQLADGGFVITFTSNHSDQSGLAVWAQVYNADGTLRAPQFRVNGGQYGTQADASIAALADGSFVVVWISEQADAYDGQDVYAKRFAADGSVLNEEFVVDIEHTAGNQRWPSVAATADGFVVVWEHETSEYAFSYDGSGGSVWQQRFTIDGLNATADTAHRPTLVAADARGGEDTAIHIDVTAALSASAVGTESLSLSVAGIPVGATLSDGAGHTFTATVHQTGVDITGWTLSGLSITSAPDSEADFTLRIRATSTDSATGDTVTNEDQVFITVDARADAMDIGGRSERVNSYTAGDQVFDVGGDQLSRSPIASWADGSYVVVWQSRDQDGSEWGVYGQRYDADGNPVGTEFQVNSFTAGTQMEASVVTLAGGGFVVTWSSFGQIAPTNVTSDPYYSYLDVFSRVYDAGGNPGAVNHVNTYSPYATYQMHSDITALSDGGYLIAWHSEPQDGSSYGIYAQRYDASGATVGSEFQLSTTTGGEQSWPSIQGLPGGGFIAVWNSNGQAGGAGHDVVIQRFDNNGQKVGGEAFVNQTLAGNQFHANVTVLADGGWLVLWQSDNNDGSSWAVMGRVYNADGSARGDQFIANRVTSGDQSKAQAVALADGGFLVAWHGQSEDINGYGVFGQRFDSEGDAVGGEFPLDGSRTYGDQLFPFLTAGSNGSIVAVWQGHDPASDGYWGDGSGWGVFGTRFTLDANPAAPTGGEAQVNTKSAHDQTNADIATLDDGSYVVVWRSAPSRGVGDISSNGVFAQRYSASGQPVGSEFTVNTTLTGDQTNPQIAALAGGGFVVTWQSSQGDGAGYGIFAQQFNAAGAAIGSEFQVNSSGGGNQYDAQITALTGANAGGFVITWQQDNGQVEARVFDASGNPVGPEFTVNQQIPNLNGPDGQEYQPAIAATADGGFVIVWRDSDTDGYGSGVFGQRYSVSLSGGTVTPLTGTQPDGSTAAGNFRVNTETYGYQYEPRIVALAGGGFVVIFQSDVADSSGAALVGQIYNAAGARVGGEFVMTSHVAGTQNLSDVVAMPDGCFLLTWQSDHNDGFEGYDVFVKRFASDGRVLNEEQRVNSYGAGYQGDPAISVVGDGFTVVWTSTGQDGSAGGVFQQHFSFDAGPNGGAVADRPTLVASDATGDEDTAIALTVSGGLVDTDGSETFSLEVSDIPVGATLADGNGHSFTATAADRTVDIAGWTLSGLTISPAADSDADFTLQLRAQSRETSSGDIAWNTDTIRVTVNSVAEVQLPYNDEFDVNTTTTGSQYDPLVAAFADGSFIVVWTSDSNPGGNYEDIIARRFNADGTPAGAEFIVNLTNTGYYENRPDVTVLSDGGFLISWTQLDESGWGVFGQRFDAAGARLNLDGTSGSSPVRINDTTARDQYWPEVTALADGGWIVTWQSYDQEAAPGQPGDETWGIYAKRFAANGSVVQMYDAAGIASDEVRINVTVAGHQQHAAVVQLAGGGFAFSWYGPDADGGGQYVRLYDASGHPITSIGNQGEILANTTTNSEQGAEGGAMAALLDGGVVVTWHSYGQDGSAYGIYGQIFNADGTTRGGEFHVSSYAYDNQQEPRVTSLPDGGFMVVWTSANQDGDSWGVYGQRFDATGDAVGAEFRLNETTGADQSTPAIAVQPDGSGVIVVWEAPDASGGGIDGKRIPLPDAATELAIDTAGVEQQVNSYTTSDQTYPSVTKLDDGSYVVVWQSHGQDGSSWGVYAKHFDSDGDAIQLTDTNGDPLWVLDGNGDPILVPDGQGNMVQVPLTEFRVNSYTNSEQRTANVVATADGGFMVVFQSYGNNAAGDGDWGVYARKYDAQMHVEMLTDAAGNPVAELRINSYVNSTQQTPKAALLADGSVVVTWESYGVDGDNWGIASRRIDASGQLAGVSDTVVNATTTDHQGNPSIAALTDGDYVITWNSYNHDGSDWGIYAQRFNADGTRDGQEFLVNTLTDSTQTYPSIAGLSDGGYVIAWQTYTGADSDNSGYGIAGQRYDASGNAVGGEFLINGVGYQDQTQVTLVAAPDGGFVVAWTSYQADGSSNGVVARRFDAQGNATEPYGDDVLVNTYSLGDQSGPAIAMLDRGFVAVWHSQNQDGNGYSIEMQRFQGQGLEPPPLIVDAAHGGDNANDLIFSTLQEALDAAEDGDTVILKGGTYNLSATAVVDVDDLRIKNAVGETVIINGPAGGAALQVGSGLNITLRADAVERLVFNAGAGAPAAVDLLGLNSGTEILRVTINANGDYGLRLGGGQNGVSISDSVFGGAAEVALVLVRGTASGVAASTGVNVLDSLFSGTGGSGLVTEATGGQILENVFSGDFAEGFAALVVWAAGGDIQDNTFSGPGAGAWFYDLANAYAESVFISQNAFPAGWTWVQERNGVFSTLEETLATAQAGDTIQATAGDYSDETGLTVADDNLKINAPAGATGIVLTLGSGVTTVTFNDAAAVTLTGNSDANVVYAGSGADSVHGAGGNDQLEGRGGDDELFGDAGDDTLIGGGGDDDLQGGADSDRYVVNIGEGHDTVSDASGSNDVLALYSTNFGSNDSVVLDGAVNGLTATFNGDTTANVTASGVDALEVTLDNSDSVTLTGALNVNSIRINGGTGANVIDASGLTSGAPITFTGGRGNDSFTGSSGLNDTVDYSAETDPGDVTVNLANGTATDTHGDADTLSGVEHVITGAGDDSITGSSAANRIEAGAGNDTLAGGLGRDSFIFRAGFGQDTISDFGSANEILRFDAAVFATVADLLAASSVVGGDTVINAGGGNTLTLAGVTNLGAWNIDILGNNDAPTLRAGVPSATLREVGQGVGGTATSTVALTPDDVDGTVAYDSTALAADGWVQGPVGVWTKNGTYGQAVLTTATNSLAYNLDNARPATQALQTGQSVSEVFTVPAIDNGGLTTTRAVTFSVDGSNDAPVGVVDAGTAVEAGVAAGGNATGNVLTNDTDVDAGDTKAVSAVSFGATNGTVGSGLDGAYGTLTLNADGTYSYAIDNANSTVQALRTAAQTLTEVFTYTVRDTLGATSSTTLTITIQGANDAPVAVADTGTADEAGVAAGSNATGNVLTNDTDVDTGDTKTVSAISGGTVGQALTGTYGALTLNANGTYSYVVDNANAAVNALRTTANTLTDSFTYTVVDTAGATSSTTLTITIRGTNDAPVATADTGTAVEAGASAGSNASGNLLTNDTDVDTGDTKAVTAFSQGASNGTVGSGLAGAYGTLTVNANGAWTYVVDDSNATVQALRLAGETLTDVFSYTMRDTAGATSSSTLTVTIQGANDAPVGVNDAGSATEAGVAVGSNASGNILTNDTDVDGGDSKTVSAISGGTVGVALDGSYGALTLNADGSYSYVVDNANGAVNALRLFSDTLTDVFTYTVRDTAGATSTATLTITVHGANDAPIGVNDTGTAVEGGTSPGSNAGGNVLTNDTDVDTGDGKTVSALSGGTVGSALAGSYGSLTLNADGGYSYVVDNANAAVQALRLPGDTLTDSFTYTVRDTAGAISTATLTITIQGANDAPVAVDDAGSASLGVDGGPANDATGNVLDNDADVDGGDGKAVTALTGGTVGSPLAGEYGTLTLNADGTYTYVIDELDPAVVALGPTDSISETFSYTVTDTAGATDTAVLTVTIFGANESPTAVADVGTAIEAGAAAGSNATGNVLTNDTDPDDGDSQTITQVKFGLVSGTVGQALAGEYGSLTLNADGSYSYAIDNSDAAVNALRTASDTLTEVFTYTMRDTAGATSTTTLTITIQGANDAPVAVADTGTAVEAATAAGSNATGNVLTNDTDVDSADSKTVSAVTGGTVGSALAGTYGSLTLNADGTYAYVVDDSNAAVQALRTAGQTLTDAFTYTVSDAAGASSQTTLTITIQGANDAPVAVADTGSATEAGTAAGGNASGNVLTNDTDVDGGDSKTVTGLAGGTVGSALAGTYGSLTLNANGSYSYVIDNGNAAVDALRTFSDTLTDTFTYTLTDAAGATSSTTLTITVHGANDAPVAVADTGTAVEAGTSAGGNASGNVLTNDTDVDSGDGKTVSALSGGAVGSALAGTYGSLTLNADGSYSYVVDDGAAAVQALRTAGQTLTDVFTYTVRDTAGATSSTTLTITIQGANDAPVAVADTGSATEAGTGAGSNATGNVLTNDTDVDGGDSKTVTALSGGLVGSALAGDYGSLTLNADGTYSYVVANGNAAVDALRTSGDTLTDTFTYTVTDAAGATSSTTLTITVHGANDAPAGVNDSGTAVEAGTTAGSHATGNVLSNDTDVDTGDSKTVSALTGGAVGSALAGDYGSLTLNADGSYTYVVDNSDPAVNALRTAGDTLTDVFTYTVRDAAGATSTATLTVTVQGANDAPVANDDSGFAGKDGDGVPFDAVGNVLTNDTDVDNGDAKTVSAIAGGTVGAGLVGDHGTLTLNADGSYRYVTDESDPAVLALGPTDSLTETFTYTVTDAAGATDTAVLTITVYGANEAPVAVADVATAVEAGVAGGTDPSGNVLTNDTDEDAGDTQAVTEVRFGATIGTLGQALSGAYGSLTLNADGSYDYVVDNGNPAVDALRTAGTTLTETFTYTLRDAVGLTSTTTLTITLQGANDAVVATDDLGTATDGGPNGSGNVLANDTDVDAGDSQTVSAVTGGAVGTGFAGQYGTLTLNANGAWTYVVNGANAQVAALGASQTLTDSFTYTVTDAAGATDTASLDITVHGINDAPVLDLQVSRGGTGTVVGFGDSTGPVTIIPADVLIDDPDDTVMASATLKLTNPASGDRLGISNASALAALGITASSYDTVTGILTLTGPASESAFQQALHLVTFNSVNPTPPLGDRLIQVTVTDGLATSNTAVATVQVVARMTLYGTAGNDVLTGNVGGDTLLGRAGDDVLKGMGGNDLINGEAGIDRLYGGDGADRLIGGDDADSLYGENDNDNLSGDAGDDKLYGGDGDDTLSGGTGKDVLTGGAGGDTLRGDDDDDTLNGEAGVDRLYGGNGVDRLNGGVDGDFLYGDAGDDTLTGFDGDDTLTGGTGADKIYGNLGNDRAYGGDDNDQILGDAGADTLNGDGGDDKIYGGDDNDVINGGIGNDFLRGDAGDDKLTGADGDDDMAGGIGNDVLNGGAGLDLMKGEAGDDQLSGDVGADRLYGGDGTDKLYGGDDNDQVWGDAGNDTILGQAGDDTLWGGTGLDSLYGGDGADQVHGGDDADYLSGDAGNDSLWGDAGDDRMLGGDGDDVLIGGIGLDTMTGGSGSDRFVFTAITDSAAGAADRITDFNGALDTVDLSAIDANVNLGGNQAFTWAAAFTGVAGQAVLTYSTATKVTTLSLDNNGDGNADFALTFTGQVTSAGGGFIL